MCMYFGTSSGVQTLKLLMLRLLKRERERERDREHKRTRNGLMAASNMQYPMIVLSALYYAS